VATIPRLIPTLILAIGLASVAAAAELETAEEIDACISANRPEQTSVATLTFRAKDRVGSVTEKSGTLTWKKFDDGLSRVVLRFHYPNDLRGSAVLLIGKKEKLPDMFMCLPALQKVRRVTTRMVSSSMFGTDFSYEDFQRLQGYSQSLTSRRLEDAVVDGRPVYVVERTLAADSGSAYERIVDYVDRETCVALKTESHETGGRLRKALIADPAKLERIGGLWVPRSSVMRDLLDETETSLEVEKIEIDEKVSRKVFTKTDLERNCH
jgi:hypothetical protein